MICRCRAKCATDAFTLQAPEMILMESIVPTTEICLTFAERKTPPRVLVAGARAKYVLANRRVVKRDSGNIISGAFICLFYMSIILQLAVEIKYKMSYNILIWA